MSREEKKIKVGDRIWLRIPHNGTISHVHKDGSITVNLDLIEEGTQMGRFGEDEFEVINP